jgi:hypothetical protein
LSDVSSGSPNHNYHRVLSYFGQELVSPSIRGIDLLLRRYYGIFEYDSDERCVLRLSLRKFNRPGSRPDETAVYAGADVGELHLWNEHVAKLSLGRDFRFVGEFRRGVMYSLRALALWTSSTPAASRLRGFCGDIWIPGGEHSLSRVFTCWGFQVDSYAGRYGFWDHLYAQILAHTFNPGMDWGPLRRVRVWISRAELLRRYGAEKHGGVISSRRSASGR